MKVRIWVEELGYTRIVFFDVIDGKIQLFNPYTGMLKKIELGEETPSEYVMKIPHTLSEELLQGLADALSEKGVKTDKYANIAGTLKATLKHLEDMRRLVFRKK